MAEQKRELLPDDILPEQIVEDDDGRMRIVPAEQLFKDNQSAGNPLNGNEISIENMENDLPCADVMAYDADDRLPPDK